MTDEISIKQFLSRFVWICVPCGPCAKLHGVEHKLIVDLKHIASIYTRYDDKCQERYMPYTIVYALAVYPGTATGLDLVGDNHGYSALEEAKEAVAEYLKAQS